jgi:ergothioneine biosynthesis protein EgtB
MRAQRRAVCQLPLLAAAKAGVIKATTGLFMTQSLMSSAAVRRADAALLASALGEMRARTLGLFAATSMALNGRLDIGYAEEVNPPLWELGHVGWFEEFWIARNSQRHRGAAAQLEAARAASLLPGADSLYDSSNVAHARRWHLSLPDVARTQAYLAQVRERTLALLRDAGDGDDALYFFRLIVAHEAMHHEAGRMIAQGLGLDIGALAPGDAHAAPRRELAVAGGTMVVGADEGGFAFDNELGQHIVEIADFRIDSRAVTWREVLPFIEADGYADASHWSEAGRAWRKRALPGDLPRHVARDEQFEHGFKRAAFGHWLALDPDAPAVHLSAHEAQAWCRWAGRRLPSEHEWTLALQQHGEDFAWGEVWEWTASPFVPWPGFVAHAYRDYSQPWFDGRPVLKGGSFATQPFMKHPRYRNFFLPGRNDVFAGFRSCAL